MYIRFIVFIALAFTLFSCSKQDKKDDEMVDLEHVVDKTDIKIAELTGLLEKDPQNASLYNKRGLLYLEKKEFTKAIEDAEKAIFLEPKEGQHYLLKAKILRSEKKLSAAMKVAKQAEEMGFQNAELNILIGEIYLILKEYQKSLDYLNNALKLSPFNEYAYFYKGIIYAESGDTTRAISSFQTSIEQSSEFIDPYNELIRIYNAKKDYSTALQYIRSGLRFDPKNSFLWYNEGVTLQAQRQIDSAMSSYRKAVFYDSTFFLAHYNLGILNYQNGNYDKAVKHLDKVGRFTTSLPQAKLLLGDIYERRGEYKRAMMYYEEVLQVDPSNAAASEGLRRATFKQNQPVVDTLSQKSN